MRVQGVGKGVKITDPQSKGASCSQGEGCSTAGSVETATKCSFLSVRDPGDRSSVQPVGWRDGTVLGRTASTCGRAAVQ